MRSRDTHGRPGHLPRAKAPRIEVAWDRQTDRQTAPGRPTGAEAGGGFPAMSGAAGGPPQTLQHPPQSGLRSEARPPARPPAPSPPGQAPRLPGRSAEAGAGGERARGGVGRGVQASSPPSFPARDRAPGSPGSAAAAPPGCAALPDAAAACARLYSGRRAAGGWLLPGPGARPPARPAGAGRTEEAPPLPAGRGRCSPGLGASRPGTGSARSGLRRGAQAGRPRGQRRGGVPGSEAS